MAHYNAAAKYLDAGKKTIEATGGIDWKKYMHPKYQRRIFFPELWSKQELEEWGQQFLKTVNKIIKNRNYVLGKVFVFTNKK